MLKRIIPYCSILVVVLASTLILWLPFLTRSPYVGYVSMGEPVDMMAVYSHWEGPLYVLVAKTWYSPHSTLLQQHPMGLATSYLPAHFPLYPIFIATLAPLVGYLKSMLFIPVLFAILYLMMLYQLLKKYKLTSHPLLLTVVAAFITPRFFVVRSVGAPETIFLFFIIVSIYFFMDKKYLLASLFGVGAVLTKSPGIFLAAAYGLVGIEQIIRERKIPYRMLWVLFMPLALLGFFSFFYLQTGDFFAHFHSADNVGLLKFPPFQVFNQYARWVATGWLEGILFLFLFYGISAYYLFQKKTLRPFFYVQIIFLGMIVSLQHKDIARYSLPMLPGALIAFEKFFTSRAFLVVAVVLLPALYLYAWNFMVENRAPILDWAPFQ